MNGAILAGAVSTVVFAASTLPMLLRAARTRDLASYSRGHLVLTNAGNLVHTIYVASLPAGPVWALHGFYLVSTALMLFWHLRYVGPGSGTLSGVRAPAAGGAGTREGVPRAAG